MPPENRTPLNLTRHDDGTWDVTFRQSWVNSFYICPERARLELTQPELRVETDASAAGTVTHLAIERMIGLAKEGVYLDPSQAAVLGTETAVDYMDGRDVQWVKYGEQAWWRWVQDWPALWAKAVLPTLDVTGVCELPFNDVWLGEHDGINVHVNGTIDYVLPDRAFDWKTSGQSWKPWEKQRWAVQASIYCAALRIVQPFTPALGDHQWDDFEFVVLNQDDPEVKENPQRIVAERPVEWDGWTVRQLASIARMAIELGVDTQWPLNDQHALCSPKWCPVWSGCKGLHVQSPRWAQPVKPKVVAK